MQTLPVFDLDAYRSLLVALAGRGYALVPVTAPIGSERTLRLRHDIDFFPDAAERVGRVEAEAGVRSTYYVLLSGPYNVFHPSCQRSLRALVAQGHEMGLHYDLEAYPANEAAARAQLLRQVTTLAEVAEAPVHTISMHQPHRNGTDLFRAMPEFKHAGVMADAESTLYISDSCRGWRDDGLLRCLGDDPPQRVMLLTHPELWLDGAVRDRFTYLRRVLAPAALAPLKSYYQDEVCAIWRSHQGGRAHDEREGLGSPAFLWPDRAWVEGNLGALEGRFAEFTELPWTREQILRDVTGKWQHSLVVVRSVAAACGEPATTENLLGFSFNSLRDGRLYVHALFVAPSERRNGLGRAILDRLRERAAGLGLAEIGLRVDLDNTAALGWWLAQGFRVVGADGASGPLALIGPAGA